ncbi:MAG TPA: hypothetical protein VLR45_05950, partial [Desulfoprunum sp.]|nr:hypothetical protein [Desulfoprunum sp.]
MSCIVRLLAADLLTAVILSFIGGIGLSSLLLLPPSPLVALIGATIIGTLTLYLRRQTFAAHLSLLGLFLLLGILHGSIADRPPSSPSHIFNLIEKKRE